MSEQQSYLPLIDLAREALIVCEAIDPVTGAQVTGVTVANVAISYQPDVTPDAAPELPPQLTFAPGVD